MDYKKQILVTRQQYYKDHKKIVNKRTKKMWTITSWSVDGGVYTGTILYHLSDTDTFTRDKTITEEQYNKYYEEVK